MVATVENINPNYKTKRDLVKYITPSSDIDEVMACADLTEMFAVNFSRSYSSDAPEEAKFKEIDYKKNIAEEIGNMSRYVVETNEIQVVFAEAKFSIDQAKNYEHYLSIFQKDGRLVHRVLIDEQRGFGCLQDQKMILWIDEGLGQEGPKAWGFSFKDKDSTVYAFEWLNKLLVEA